MDKKMTLAQTWKNCLRMWKWVVKEYDKKDKDWKVWGSGQDLKIDWIDEHPEYDYLADYCFFCEWSVKHRVDGEYFCSNCPGRMVNKKFDCLDDSYHYSRKPKKFYKKLLQLDEKRRSKRGKK